MALDTHAVEATAHFIAKYNSAGFTVDEVRDQIWSSYEWGKSRGTGCSGVGTMGFFIRFYDEPDSDQIEVDPILWFNHVVKKAVDCAS